MTVRRARGLMRGLSGVPREVLILAVRAYQLLVSPLLGPVCRFYPSCSSYAVTALRTHGAVRGTWLVVRRLLRCHPWNPGGVDHVPTVSDLRAGASLGPTHDHDHGMPTTSAPAL